MVSGLLLRIARRASRRPLWSIRGLLLFALGAFFACGSPADQNDNSRDALPSAFLTPVAAAEQSGLTAYWVGRRLDAGGLSFHAPSARFESLDSGAYLRIEYLSEMQGGGSVGFTLSSSRAATYEEAVGRELSRPGEVTPHAVLVRGWPATLFERKVGRWTNVLVLAEAPDSLVLAMANASIVDGRQVNPLDDPGVLLAVLEEHLRPYPE